MSKKNLGIFGDSSADPNKNFSHSWVELLAKEINFDNFAKQGSSLVYTYDQLIKHGNNYQKIIVFIAPIGRLWAPHINIHKHYVNHQTVDLVYSNASTKEKVFLDSVKNYFLHVWNYERESLIQRSMIDSIRNMFSSALLVPVTHDSIYNYNGLCMRDISLLDYEFYEISEYTPDFGRTCHMNKKNNKIFYEKIKEWLETKNFIISIKDFEYPEESKEELFLK